LCHIFTVQNKFPAATAKFKEGLTQCPQSIPLWIAAARLDLKMGVTKARATLAKARLKNPNNPDLWTEAIKLELESSNTPKPAQLLLAKALQECPKSGKLWALAIQMDKKPEKRMRCVDALKVCGDAPEVLLQVGILFWEDRKIDNARTWLLRAVALDPTIGDSWATLLKFEIQHGTQQQRENLVKKCVEAQPHHGEKWKQVSKLPESTRLTTEQLLVKVASLML